MKERLFESSEKAQGSGKKSVRWRFVWIMLGVFLIGMAALLLYHRFSMNGLIVDKLEKLRSEMVINCAALDDEIYMTSAIPSAVNKSNYYTFIKYDQSEQLDRKYYSVLEFIREDFAKQVYLRGSASESLLYFRGTGSICTTRHIYPVAEDCFVKGLLFEATPSERLISTLRIVGGGCNNLLLNRLTREATGLSVIAGPSEATAFGNIAIQKNAFPIPERS